MFIKSLQRTGDRVTVIHCSFFFHESLWVDLTGFPRLASLLLALYFFGMGTETVNASPPDPIAFGNVIYHHFLGSSAQAYTRALYFEQRNLSEEKNLQMAITRAGLALDLGLDQLAQSILATIREEDLRQLDRQGLHFQLARDAYRRQDWNRFENELNRIGPGSKRLSSSHGIFLQAELARLKGDFAVADKHLVKIGRKNVLRYYSSFNIGITAYAAGDTAGAKHQLSQLVGWPARTLEQLLIAERGRIVLANIAIEGRQYDTARKWLTGITSTGQYGPAAFATLAHLSMQDQDYARAAELWFYVVTNFPWHPAVTDAHVSLPYALEQVRGSNQAYTNYEQAADRLDERRESLGRLLEKLGNSDAGRLAKFLMRPGENRQTQFIELADTLGHDDWASWLASDYSQRLVNTWHRVSAALDQLTERRDDLDILLVVDRQQQRRIRNAADIIHEDNYRPKIDEIEKRLNQLKVYLAQLTQQTGLGDALLTLATAEEIETLNALQRVAVRAVRLDAKNQTLLRIKRLRGLVLYRIHDDLPVRVRERQVQVTQMAESIAASRDRIRRIELSASVIGETESVDGRIALLSKRTDKMLAVSKQVLGRTGEALLAQIGKGIRTELSGIEQQLVYVRLAMARISDVQLLVSGAAQRGVRP